MSDTLQLAKLTKNPFTLVPEERVTVWAGYQDMRRQLLDVVESCRSDKVGLSEFAILHGEYGTGKSHALRYLKYWITEARQQEFNAPVVYLHSLKVAASMSFVALYRKIMEELMTHIQETAEWLHLVIEETVKGSDPSARHAALGEAINKKYEDHAITPSFPPLSLLLKGVKDDSEEAISLLLGNSLPSARRAKYRTYNLTGPIETEYDAVKCLGAYVNLCTRGAPSLAEGSVLARNKAFYFLLDELEVMQDFRPQEALSMNQGLRDLINACPENCCFLFGMSGDARLIFALLTQPVMRRMSRQPIEIRPLDTEESVTFLKEVLKGYRAYPSDPDEYPLREATLRRIAEETQIKTAAELFRNCRRVLEKAVLTGRLQPDGWIEEGDVQELL